jgi:tRNA A-37 threonylcarbamoyl transferase component Bud32
MTQTRPGRRIGGGETAQIYTWDNNRVLKLFESWVPSTWAEYEIKTTRFAHQSGLPVPEVDKLISYDNRRGIIMERIGGKMMISCLLPKLWKTSYYAGILAKLHVSVNSVRAPDGFLSVRNFLENRIRNEDLIPQKTREAVLHILEQLPDGVALCHFDLHPLNVMMSPRGPVIIDWSGAAKGDPMADIARSWLLCTLPPFPRPITGLMTGWLKHFYSVYLKQYESLAGIDEKRINLWKIPILAARLREEKTDKRKKYLLGLLGKLLE